MTMNREGYETYYFTPDGILLNHKNEGSEHTLGDVIIISGYIVEVIALRDDVEEKRQIVVVK